ncbi:MAG: type IV secretion system DNA-binding domain-containing protein [Patescibacteria group bacterium]
MNNDDQLQMLGDLGRSVSNQGEGLLQNPWFAFLLFSFFVLIVFIVAILVIRRLLIYYYREYYSFRRVVFQILMPKESEEQSKKDEVIQKKDIKEVIAEVENLYASLIGTGRVRDWSYWLYKIKTFWIGSHRHISFEIVAHEGVVKFFVVGPTHLRQYIEQQIHAVYPNASIETIEDYNIFETVGSIVGTYLKASRDLVLPLKTFKKLDTDPAEGITNSLSKLAPDEGAAIQILLRPASAKWRHRGLRIAREIHKGRNLDQAVKASGSGFISMMGKIFGLPFKVLQFLVHDVFSTKSANKQGEPPTQSEEDQMKHAPVRLLKREEEVMQSLEEKFSKAHFEANIRLVASAKNKDRAKIILRDIIGSFSQFASQQTNNKLGEVLIWLPQVLIGDFIHRNFREWKKVILSTEELASIYHFPLPSTETPNIVWLTARRAAPPVNLPKEGLVLGKTVFRSTEQLIRMKPDDRRRHVYIIGKSGTGKSVMISNMAIQDIQAGHGVCVVDPHGDLVESILANIPKERADDVVIFNPADVERPIGLNMLEARSEEEKDFAVQEMISIFYKLFPPEMIGPMFEHNMRNVMLTLMSDLENPGTIAEIPRMFTDTEFQQQWTKKLKDPVVRSFWEKEMAKTSDFHKSEMLGYLISKVGRFVENEMMRNIIGQTHSGFNLREVMDKKKILLVNLSKGKVGEVNSNLLGLIIVSKLQMAALGRADLPEEQRNDFYLYIDEFQNFITDSIATILSEARKYRLNLIIAHQYLGQLSGGGAGGGNAGDTKIRDAVLGTTGTLVAFKIGAEDAEIIAKEFAPTVNQFDLVNVEKFNAYIKLLVDNQASRPFNMQTLPPTKGNRDLAEKIRELSRLKHGKARAIVEAEIMERTQLGAAIKDSNTSDVERSL